MLEKLEARIAELAKIIDQSAANHNMIMGRFNEAKELYELFKDIFLNKENIDKTESEKKK